MTRPTSSRLSLFSLFAAPVMVAGLMLLLVAFGQAGAASAAPPKPQAPSPQRTLADQIVPGYPLSMTAEDNTSIQIRYRDYSDQFFGSDAEGVYLWVNVGGVTTVYGPQHVPAGRTVNPYTPVSNVRTGAGTPASPWIVTTVNTVPNTNLRLTQRLSYVNGSEFAALTFRVEQIAGSAPVTVTLFHAADLYTAASDTGYGYYDPSTGAVGDYYTATTGSLAGSRLYQQFVPNASYPMPTAYQEGNYGTIWANIGDTSGPGSGFDNSIISDTLHDSGAGLQWTDLSIPAGGGVTVGDTDLFSPHASLCGNFSDVPYGSFYYDYIYFLACNGIVSGYSDTTFRPNENTTRGQLAKIAANSAGFNEPVTGQTFADVLPGVGFYPYIQRMATRGLISGYACGGVNEPCDSQNRPYFRTNEPVTRGQLAKIIANAKGLSGTPTGQTFADVPSSNPFYVYVERLASVGTISGYSCGSVPTEPCDAQRRPYFRLGANATRGQISKIDKLTFFP